MFDIVHNEVVPLQDDERVEELCSKVISATNEEERTVALSELRRVLREHIDRLRAIVTPQIPLIFLEKDDNDAA